MFNQLMTDKVTLVKNNGNRYENIRSNVQTKLIFIDDATIPIEEGDKLIRILPNTLEEVYIVVDRGFFSAMGGMKAHYQVKVRKENITIDEYSNSRHTNVNNIYGNVNNSQIQQNVKNSSQKMSVNEEYEKKVELIKYISILKENVDKVGLESDKLSVIAKSVEIVESELKKSKSKSETINECLGTIRNVLQGVVGSLIASGLIHQMGIFIK
jgi:hypothetical protein